MKNTSGIRPVEYRVLVLPDKIEEKTSGGIILPEAQQDRHQMAQQEGVVVAFGGNAFSDWKDESPPKAGDRVYFARYQGAVVTGEDGKEYRLCNDKDIGAVISEGAGSRMVTRKPLSKTETPVKLGAA